MSTLNGVNREHLRVALVHIAQGHVPAALRSQVDGDREYLTDALDGKLDAEGLVDALAIADEYLGVSAPLAGLAEIAPDAHLEMAYEDRFEME